MASHGFELSPLPLAKSRDNRWKLRTLRPSESDGRTGGSKSYFHVSEELGWGFQLIRQDVKARIVVKTLLTRANVFSFPAVPST